MAPLGIGVYVQKGSMKKRRGSVTISGSIIEGNLGIGVHVLGSDGVVEGSIVRSTLKGPKDQGFGVLAGHDETGDRASVLLQLSLVENNANAGVVAKGSDATLEATVVRRTQLDSAGQSGFGVLAVSDAALPSKLALRRSLLDRNHEAGALVSGSSATIEGTAVRDTIADVNGLGVGLGVEDDATGAMRGTLALLSSVIAHNAGLGVLVTGSDATIEACVVDASTISAGSQGAGIAVEYVCTAPTTCDPSRRSPARARRRAACSRRHRRSRAQSRRLALLQPCPSRRRAAGRGRSAAARRAPSGARPEAQGHPRPLTRSAASSAVTERAFALPQRFSTAE